MRITRGERIVLVGFVDVHRGPPAIVSVDAQTPLASAPEDAITRVAARRCA